VTSCANGQRSLDDPRFMRRFDRSYRDSGAIFTAATNGSSMARASYCNWGTRIDANAWGENTVAAGYGTDLFPNNDPRQAYTRVYAGTSAATPMVTATVVALQSAARRQIGRSLAPAEIFDLLHNHGVPSPEVIGRRPNLRELYDYLGIHDGLSLDDADALPGGSSVVQLTGPAGSAALLYCSFGTADLALGFNRHLQIDPATMASLGFFLLPTGTASWTLQVPNLVGLDGAELYFQAAVLSGGTLHVTNGGQFTVL
jgi:hypothetical protein